MQGREETAQMGKYHCETEIRLPKPGKLYSYRQKHQLKTQLNKQFQKVCAGSTTTIINYCEKCFAAA